MSKPQVASEPTLEEILASIRKMISDDKPGPSPLPDTMGRTPFGEALSRVAPASESGARASGDTANPARRGAAGSPTFNSLADALKVATALSDQRRSLQQEVASALERTPRTNLDALTEVSVGRADAATRAGSDARATTPADAISPNFPSLPDRRSESIAPAAESKRDLLSFDFGTMVPQRDVQQARPQAADAKSAASTQSSSEAPAAEAPELAKGEQPGEPRVLQLRTGPNSSSAHGLNGAGLNIATFPRSVREAPKPAETASHAAAEKQPEVAIKRDEPTAESRHGTPETESQAAASPLAAEALAAKSEALLDAVVELVQQQPSALSVFTSGASFISGVGASKAAEKTGPTVEARPEVAKTDPVRLDDVAAQPKMDRAAAELLRPMLRQWLAENMGRILEEALRSEITEQSPDGKEPSKT